VPALEPILERVKSTGILTAEERKELIRHWSQAYPIIRRPPFFAKDFLWTPPTAIWLTWLAVRATHVGEDLFRRFFSPSPKAKCDLLVKEIGWTKQAHSIVRALEPELLLLFRHPCAVVASQLQGRKLGLLHKERRSVWLEHFGAACEQLGWERAAIEAMEDYEWLALDWLLMNRTYLELLREYPRSHAVVYEELCRELVKVSSGVFDFLGWKMGAQTLQFLRQSTCGGRSTVATMMLGQHAYFGVYRDPRESLKNWKNVLTEAQAERIVALVRPHFPYEKYWGVKPIEPRPAEHQTAAGARSMGRGKLVPAG